MSEYIDQDTIYNCSEETLNDEGYFVKKDWDEWLSEWRKHHFRQKIMFYIHEKEENKEVVIIDENIIEKYQKYVSIDASVSSIYLNRESLRRTCINIARTMRKTLGKNKQDLEDFKHDKDLTGLKYTNIRTKVNFIQITVIIASTIITFLETMKDKFELTNNISMTIAPILLSTYIGLALAISRFFKLDDHKEELCKLDEAQSFVISGLRHRARMIQSMMPLYCDPDVDTRKNVEGKGVVESPNPDRQKAIEDYFAKVEKIIEDQSKDGLEETMSNCKQKFDLVMNLSEKVYYKNILLTISIDEDIVDGNKRRLYDVSSKEELTNNELKIKKDLCCLWKYLCCFCNDCMYHYIDKDNALQLVNERREKTLADKKKKHNEDNENIDDEYFYEYLPKKNVERSSNIKSIYSKKLNKQLSISSVIENENNLNRDYTVFNKSNNKSNNNSENDIENDIEKGMVNSLESENDNKEAKNEIILSNEDDN